ncbi:nucleoside hydrolase [Shinella sp. CPCC 100929]|uniref:Nucleoside hydrolase n=1 Tax=Shinella lacus TaxID=2654216 RepID=A0ABT1RBS5_9HYPH|nr:nucleoside hydrolase [Shinella lacus]MCQ4632648.1 nucleoside hydrolase [Shinella lacus]
MKLIIDTDPGIDDAFALLYAHSHPDVEVNGITTIYGNVEVDVATRNALWLAEQLGLDVPVSRGAAKPLAIEKAPSPEAIHGACGFGPLPMRTPKAAAGALDAADFLIESCGAAPGEITILALGPLTNLATALKRDAGFAASVREVCIMGGALFCPGNVTSLAEANIFGDPHAAAAVYAAHWPIRSVGLDVTDSILVTSGQIIGLATSLGPLGPFFNTIASFYVDFYRRDRGVQGAALHDPAALISLLHPELFTFTRGKVLVDTDGPSIGRTRLERGSENTLCAVSCDTSALVKEFLQVCKRFSALAEPAKGS